MATVIINQEKNSLNSDDLDKLKNVQFDGLLSKRQLAIHQIAQNKDQAVNKIARRVPIQVLATEWYSRIDASTENRTYLMENFLPVLVLGCERVLKEAQARQLVAQNKKDANFNPINVLGQYMMRHNPKHNNQNENSSYVRTMREVYQEMKEQMHAMQGNKLSKLKEDVRRRRTEREKQEKLRLLEIARRRKQLEETFKRFCLQKSGRLELDVILSSFRLYEEQIISLPDDMRILAKLKLAALPALCYQREELLYEKRLLLNEFTDCVLNVSEHMKSDLFNLFNEYFDECAAYFVDLANLNSLYKIVYHLIKMIDTTNTGYISRRRMLSIFVQFREKRNKNNLRSPFDWPVLDTFLKFENKIEEVIPPLVFTTARAVAKVMANLEESIAEGGKTSPKSSTQSDQKDESKSMTSEGDKSTSSTSAPDKQIVNEASSKEMKTSEVIKDEEIGDESLSSVKLVDRTKSANAELANGSNVAANPDQARNVELETSRIEPLPILDAFVIKQKSELIDLNKPVRPEITKKDELLFLKGGSMYYMPLEENLNAFDRTLITESYETKPANPEPIVATKPTDLLSDFDSDFLTARQALNLIHNFITQHFLSSEINMNDLITFIKDNYAENSLEKSGKLEKAETLRKHLARYNRFSACFDKIDNECSGQLSLARLEFALVDFKDGLFKEQAMNAINILKEQIMFNGKPDEYISKDEFINVISILINSVDFQKFEDQIYAYLAGLTHPDYIAKTRSELRRTWLSQIKYVGNIVIGNFEPLYKQLFLTLLKDAETHGQGKNISAYVAILEKMSSSEGIGLKYHATTPHDSQHVLGKVLTRSAKNISFNVIDNGKAEHVQRVRANSAVHFFNTSNKNDGSLVVYPLRYARNKIFGIIGVDTLQDTHNNNAFLDNEIEFYQGVANSFANAYADIIFKNRLLKCCMSAVEWLSKRCTGIENCNLFLVQLLDDQANINEDILPKNPVNNTHKIQVNANSSFSMNLKPVMRYRLTEDGSCEDLLLRPEYQSNSLEYKLGSKAYECATLSETTIEYFNGSVSYYVPLRDEEHKTVFVFEISSRNYCQNAEKYEEDFEQIEHVMYVLHKCQEEMLDERFLGSVKNKFEFESNYDQDKFEILFEKAYLNHVLGKMESQLLNQEIIELMPDGSKSIENSKAKNLIQLVADLSGDKELVPKNMLTESGLTLLKSFDPTVKHFKFNSSTSSFKLEPQNEYFESMHSFHQTLTSINASLRLLIDWSCLVKIIQEKSSSVVKSYKKQH